MATELTCEEQAALRESEARLRVMLNSLPVGVWSADAAGNLIFNSEQVRAYFGLKASDGSDWVKETAMHPDDIEPTLRRWRHCVSTGESYRVQVRHRAADGSYRWHEVRAERLYDGDRRSFGWCGVNIDIEESKRLEEAAREAVQRLVDAARIATVAELSASIADEINQPLTAVVSNATACKQWLACSPPNLDRARVAAERIVRDGMAVANIVQKAS